MIITTDVNGEIAPEDLVVGTEYLIAGHFRGPRSQRVRVLRIDGRLVQVKYLSTDLAAYSTGEGRREWIPAASYSWDLLF